jgi:hypothetical protein
VGQGSVGASEAVRNRAHVTVLCLFVSRKTRGIEKQTLFIECKIDIDTYK